MRTQQSYLERIRSKYNKIGEIWEQADRWHMWSKLQIEHEMQFVASQIVHLDQDRDLILDVGSGGYSYFNSETPVVEIDIAEQRLRGSQLAVCASAESLPLSPSIASLTICVGPVVNYCSLEEVISELSSVTKEGGLLVLHVELSNSFEFFGSSSYRADVAFVTTFYRGEEQYWVYSNKFVRRMLSAYGFEIERVRYFHIISSLIYRLSRRPNFSCFFSTADSLFQRLNLGAEIADSAIFVCRRATIE